MIRIVPSSADRIVAPTRAVGPSRHRADNQNDQNDEDNEPHFGLCLGRPLARERPNNVKIRETFPILRPSEHQQIASCAKSVDILSDFNSRPRARGDHARRLELARAAYGPSRAVDPVLPAHLCRIAHTGERRAGRSHRSRGIFRPAGAGGRQPISARRRRPRRHAGTYPDGRYRRATVDSDRRGEARLGNLARDLLVRTSACAASARDRPASYWRMTAPHSSQIESAVYQPQFSLN